MKTQRIFLFLCLLAVIFSTAGCKDEYATTTMRLQLSSELGRTVKTILPQNQSLDIYSYYIEGSGPNGKTFSVTTLSPQVMIEGLVLGTWTITATGQNAQGTDLVRGSATHQLTTTATRVDLFMDALPGTGNINITFSWAEPDFPNVGLNLYLTPQNGNAQAITSGITIDAATGTAVFTTSRPAGSYELRYELFSNNIKIAGGTEALRVIKDGSTTGTIDISLDKEVSVAPGLSITTLLTTPVEGTIQGIGASILPKTMVTATFNQVGGGGTTDVAVQWFLDGNAIASGKNAMFSTYTGNHRLDAVVRTDNPGSVGSVSWPFQASVLSNNGIPVVLSTVQDGDTDCAAKSYKLNHVSDAMFLRDGKLLVASQNSLQLCKIVHDELVVVRNFTDGGATSNPATEPYPVYGVTNIAIDILDDIVCTTAADSGILVFYHYDSETDNLEKIDYRVSDENTEQWWHRMSNPVIDNVNNLLYFFDSSEAYILYYAFTDTEATFIGASPIESLASTVPVTIPTQLAISGNNEYLGLVCPQNGSFHLMYNTLTGYYIDPGPTIIYDQFVAGGSAAAFTGMTFNARDFYTFESTGLSHYITYDNATTWEVDQTVEEPLNGVTAMVLDNTHARGWVVSAGANPGVSLLSFIGGVPTHEGFISTGTLSGKDITISPMEDLLCVVGNDNNLMLLRISDG